MFCSASCRVTPSSDTSGSVWAAPLSPSRRYPFESPTRWPACVRSRDAGRCGSDAGAVDPRHVRRTCSGHRLSTSSSSASSQPLRKYRGTIRFFADPPQAPRRRPSNGRRAKSALARAERRVRQLTTTIATLGRRFARATRGDSRLFRRKRRSAASSARTAGTRVAVAWCESRTADDGAERSVPRPLPDGVARAQPCSDMARRRMTRRSPRVGTSSARAATGARGAAAGRRRSDRRFRRKERPGDPPGGFLRACPSARCPDTCGDSGSATAFGPSMRLLRTRAATATATTTSGS